MQNGLCLYKDKIFLSASSSLKPLVLQYVHDNLIGGHSRYLKTLHRVKRDFFWKGMKSDVKNHSKCYEVCQRIKVDTNKPTGLLQPLPIPQKPWLEISMDFIEGLPKSQGFEVILVVVGRLTKYVHFLPLSHPFIVAKVAAAFMQGVFKLHGMSKSIVNDKGAVFIASFWQELFKLQGTNLAMSSTYHVQIDGQTEVVNQSLEQYLRAFVHDRPYTWAAWLHLSKFWFNTNYHNSAKMTPFVALYGYHPLKLLDYILGTT